jgi:formylglycine-generating enzyme required for sulfatase activity
MKFKVSKYIKCTAAIVFFILGTSAKLAFAANFCQNIFSSSKFLKPFSSPSTEIHNLNDFGAAMTHGMLLRPDQNDLFEVYRRFFFGDPKVIVQSDLNAVYRIIKKHPELEKPHFREVTISFVNRVYDIPVELQKYVSSQIKTAGQLRSNLFRITANLGYWKKILNYMEPIPPPHLTKTEVKNFENQSRLNFENELHRVISQSNQNFLEDLNNENIDYQNKTKALFKTLQSLESQLKQKGSDTRALHQAMVDLVNIVGFSNPTTILLLKSINGLDKIEGLKKVLDERDAIAMDLGYEGHFEELIQSLEVSFPTGFSKNEDPNSHIERLEEQVLQGSFISEGSEEVRVRSLSIQEAPFRSCLGGSDCSSRTYFDKALDPNYNYFTMTDSSNHSSGHITVVLGEAYNIKTKQTEKVAFVDKIQNVPNRELPIFLKAVSMSLQEKSYQLALPEQVGDHNGLSNMQTIRYFINDEILPLLHEKRFDFKPHANIYKFDSKYSRAYDNLSVRLYDLNMRDSESQFKLSEPYHSFLAPEDLNKNKLINDFLNLKNSNQTSEILKFISSGSFVGQLERMRLYNKKDFLLELEKFFSDSHRPLLVRKQAFFEYLLNISENDLLNLKFPNMDPAEWNQIVLELHQWSQSNDKRKVTFLENLQRLKELALNRENIKTLEFLESIKFFDVNERDAYGFSLLSQVIYLDLDSLFNWLILKPQLKLSKNTPMGLSELEIAQRLNRISFVNQIEMRLNGHFSNSKPLRTRNRDVTNAIYPKGEPIFGFVSIPAGSIKIEKKKNRRTELYTDYNSSPDLISTNSFEIYSTGTTQKMWREVLELGAQESSDKAFRMRLKFKMKIPMLKNLFVPYLPLNPAFNKGEYNPVENVSYQEVQVWLKLLNDLSNEANSQLQDKLKALFPGHQKGDIYRLPTEAERTLVMRLSGLATGVFSHGDRYNDLDNYAWSKYNSNLNHPQSMKSYGQAWNKVSSENFSHPVGLKEPVMFYGQPIYDLHGNVFEWLADKWESEQKMDFHLAKGGSFLDFQTKLKNSFWDAFPDDSKVNNLGFRLVRKHRP